MFPFGLGSQLPVQANRLHAGDLPVWQVASQVWMQYSKKYRGTERIRMEEIEQNEEGAR
jgi:hypothetical protein